MSLMLFMLLLFALAVWLLLNIHLFLLIITDMPIFCWWTTMVWLSCCHIFSSFNLIYPVIIFINIEWLFYDCIGINYCYLDVYYLFLIALMMNITIIFLYKTALLFCYPGLSQVTLSRLNFSYSIIHLSRNLLF